jgi:hypothetical protein
VDVDRVWGKVLPRLGDGVVDLERDLRPAHRDREVLGLAKAVPRQIAQEKPPRRGGRGRIDGRARDPDGAADGGRGVGRLHRVHRFIRERGRAYWERRQERRGVRRGDEQKPVRIGRQPCDGTGAALHLFEGRLAPAKLRAAHRVVDDDDLQVERRAGRWCRCDELRARECRGDHEEQGGPEREEQDRSEPPP